MNSQIEPTLERIPGQKPELEEEKKENKEPQINITTPEKDLRKTAPPLTIDQPKLEKQKVTSTTETKESKLYKKLKEKGRLKDRKNSYVFAPSILFLKPFDVIDESILKSGEKPKVKLEDLSLGNNIIDNEESSEMDNVKSLYEYNNIKEEKDPIKEKEIRDNINERTKTFIDKIYKKEYDMSLLKMAFSRKPEQYEIDGEWEKGNGYCCSALNAAFYVYNGIMKLEKSVHSVRPGDFEQDKNRLTMMPGFSFGPEKIIEFST